MTLAQIAQSVQFEADMLRFARTIGNHPARAEHRHELEMLEAQLLCRMAARPSNVIQLSDHRRAS